MEAAPRLPMISFELKVSTEPVSFGPKLKQYIAAFYREDADSYGGEIQALEQLRSAAVRPSPDVTGVQTLKRYYCQLRFLRSRFPLDKGGACAVGCAWKDAYAGVACQAPDLELELMSVLYNVGALHAQLGAADPRSSPDGMKLACTHFQCAAWAFQHARETYPQMVALSLAPEVLLFMELISLAQAQECILEKSMTDSRKCTIIAKVAAQAAEYYVQAGNALTGGSSSDNSDVGDIIGSRVVKDWCRYLKFKSAYHGCISLLYQGQQSEEQQKMGERVALYHAASEKLEEAKKLSTRLGSITHQTIDIEEALAFTQDVVEGKRKAARNENEFIYHEVVPERDALPTLQGASLVRPIPFGVSDPDVSGPDIFGRLVPMEAHEASSIYSEKKAELLREIGKAVEERDVELEEFMGSLHSVDVLVDRLQRPQGLPQELVDRAAALSARPQAAQHLVDAMGKLSAVHHDVDALLNEAQALIEKEKEAAAATAENRKMPLLSMPLNDLSREAAKYREALSKANESNEALHRAMTAHVANLRILGQPLASVDRHLQKVTLPDPADGMTLTELTRLLGKVDEMRQQRVTLLGALREATRSDDITGRLVIARDKPASELDKLFDAELAKHKPQVSLIEKNLSAQQKILLALTDTYAKLSGARKHVTEAFRRRDQTVSALIASYDAYEDLLAKANKGIDFYQKLETNVTKLLQRLRSTCRVQEEEREQKAAKQPPVATPTGPKLRDYLQQPRPAPLGSEQTEAKVDTRRPFPICNPGYPGVYQPRGYQYRPQGPQGGSRPPQYSPTDPYPVGYSPQGATGTYPASYQSAGYSAPNSAPSAYSGSQGQSGGTQSAPSAYTVASTSHSVPSTGNTYSGAPSAYTTAPNAYSTPYTAPNAYSTDPRAYAMAPNPSSTPTNHQAAPSAYSAAPNAYPMAPNASSTPPSRQTAPTGYTTAPNAYQMPPNPSLTPPSHQVAPTGYSTAPNAYPIAPNASSTPPSHQQAPSAQQVAPNGYSTAYQMPPNPSSTPPNHQGATNSQQVAPSGYSTAPNAYPMAPNASSTPPNHQVAPSGYSTAYTMAPTSYSTANSYSVAPNVYTVAPTSYTTAGSYSVAPNQVPNAYGADPKMYSTAPGAYTSDTQTAGTAVVTTSAYSAPNVYSSAATTRPTAYTTPGNTYSGAPGTQLGTNAYSNGQSTQATTNVYQPGGYPSNYTQGAQGYATQAQNYAYAAPGAYSQQAGYTQRYSYPTQPQTGYQTNNTSYPAGYGGYSQQYGYQGTQYGGQTATTTAPVAAPSSNVDLLAGLDFNVSQVPLDPVKATPAEPKMEEAQAPVPQVVAPPEIQPQATPQEVEDNGKMRYVFEKEVEVFEKWVNECLDLEVEGKWRELHQRQEKECTMSISVARCYPGRNRCPDSLPYDRNRVELPSPPAPDDYINASRVPEGLIITQAPLPATAPDFWTMVAHEKTNLVICLMSDSELTEAGFPIGYWVPEFGAQVKSVQLHPNWTERGVVIGRQGYEVRHVQVTTPWPSIEGETPIVTALAELCLENHAGNIVVHCLNGVGRSGVVAILLQAAAEMNRPRLLDVQHASAVLATHRRNPLRDRLHLAIVYRTVLKMARKLVPQVGTVEEEVVVEVSPVLRDPLSDLDPLWKMKIT